MGNDNQRITVDDVRSKLRSAVAEAGGQKAWAVAHRVSETTVCEVLRGTREPGPRVLTPLGLTRLSHAYAPVPAVETASSEARA